ncbi:hypothetical protein GGQ79_003511 [Ochrobactrum pecoris]|uniref:Uncharacterized protein n=1 Tax=Brucella pecoris TaxID=867683 RepID=A0AB34YWE5_9HYPH|nr:hypothetical protein [Brucella pecoris]
MQNPAQAKASTGKQKGAVQQRLFLKSISERQDGRR